MSSKSSIFDKEREDWHKRLGVLRKRVNDLSDLNDKGELLKKWGVGGYLKVDMNEDDIVQLRTEIRKLESRREDFFKAIKDNKTAKFYIHLEKDGKDKKLKKDKTDEKDKKDEQGKKDKQDEKGAKDKKDEKYAKDEIDAKDTKDELEKYEALLGPNGSLKIKINALLVTTEGVQKQSEKLEEYNKKLAEYKKENELNPDKIENELKKLLEELQEERDKRYYEIYGQNEEGDISSIMRSKATIDPLDDDEALELRNKQQAYDAMAVQLKLANKYGVLTGNMSRAGVLKFIEEIAVTGQRSANAIVAGASTFTSEMYWLGIGTALTALAWPVSLTVKSINGFVLNPLSKGFASVAAFFERGASNIEKARKAKDTSTWGGWFTEGLMNGAGMLSEGLMYGFKSLSFVFEKLAKYINWDNMIRGKVGTGAPTFLGALGGTIALVITLALLIAIPFTFTLSGLALAALWGGIALGGTAIGLGVAMRKTMEVIQAERELKLTPTEEARLMEYRYRHRKNSNLGKLTIATNQPKESKDQKEKKEQQAIPISFATPILENKGNKDNKEKIALSHQALSASNKQDELRSVSSPMQTPAPLTMQTQTPMSAPSPVSAPASVSASAPTSVSSPVLPSEPASAPLSAPVPATVSVGGSVSSPVSSPNLFLTSFEKDKKNYAQDTKISEDTKKDSKNTQEKTSESPASLGTESSKVSAPTTRTKNT